MTTQRDIKNTYFDALFFASATINEGKDFHLTPAQFRLFLKLIHYSSSEENITWSSENISKHLCTSIDSIDKTIQRLRQKGYINVINKQRNATTRSRTIYINWEFILEIDGLYQDHIKSLDEQQDSTEPVINKDIKEDNTTEVEPTIDIEQEQEEESSVDSSSVAYLLSQLPPISENEIEKISEPETSKNELIELVNSTDLILKDKKAIIERINIDAIKNRKEAFEAINFYKIFS